MIKKLYFTMLLVVASMTSMAQSTLNVHKKSGGVVSYAFSEKPVVTYSGDILVLTTSKAEVQYPIADLSKFTFEDNGTGIIPTTIVCKEAGETKVYDTAGMLVKTIASDQPLLIDDLKIGLYIIKNNKTTYKIIKK